MLAIIVKEIHFKDIDHNSVRFAKGDTILLDVQTMIGFGKGLHFDVDRSEVAVVQ